MIEVYVRRGFMGILDRFGLDVRATILTGAGQGIGRE
jgi:hypothetical protein